MNLLTVETLKNKAISIKEFGIGFIQIKLDNIQYINLYTDKVPLFSNSNAPHNHQEDFISRILSGAIVETMYDVFEGENGQSAFCGCGNTDSIITEKYSYIVKSINIHSQDEIYYRAKEDFHSVIASENTITLVTKVNPDNNHDAIIIANKSEYNTKHTKEELWSIVEQMLNEEKLYGIF